MPGLTEQARFEALTHAQEVVRILSSGSAPTEQPAAVDWEVAFQEPWRGPKFAGWTRVEWIGSCTPSMEDPGVGARTHHPLGDWSVQGQGASAFTADTGQLVIDSEQSGVGFALLSGKLFDPATNEIRAEATIDLTPDPGAWVGLALWAGEGNYREIGVRQWNDGLAAQLNAPCYYKVLEGVSLGPCRLNLIYSAARGWEMWAGDRMVYSETIGYRRNTLVAPVNVGLWAVNLAAESTAGTTGKVRAKVGPVTVWTRRIVT